MKKTKNWIIIGVIIALAVAAGAYFTMGEGYQGELKLREQSKEGKAEMKKYLEEAEEYVRQEAEKKKKEWGVGSSSVQERGDVDCEKNPEECAGAIN